MTPAVPGTGEDAAPGAPGPGLRRALLPLGLAAGGLALAVGVQLVFDPFRTHIPLCLVNALTGIECPGCGMIRAVHALLTGDLLLAMRSNPLLVAALPLLAVLGVRWTVRRVRGLSTALPVSRTTAIVLLGVVLVFTVLRNLPAFSFLAPISYVGG